MPREGDCAVLVAGLGPVGLLLAVLLGRLGVRVLGCDPAPGPHGLPRAATVDDEVLRLLQAAGVEIAHALQPHARVSYVTAAGRRVDVVRTGEGRLGHPPLASLHQPELERALADAAVRLPSVELRWGAGATLVGQDAQGVDARVGEAPVRAAHLVACDGGASPLRAALGVSFGGSTWAQRWLVVDARVDRPLARAPHPHFVGDRTRPIVTLPMGAGRHRWEWMLHPGEDPAPLLEPAALHARLAPWLDGARARVERAVPYQFHARTAERWRVGRVLLAGDAAHVMPPFAGQGFASGARDAGNLAWKLDAVLHGAPDALLDSYEAERRPHVRAMQQLAVRWGAVLQTTRPRAAAGRDAVLSALDGTRAQDWLLDNAKPLPTTPAGAWAERPHRFPPHRAVGALFPQPRLPDGRLLDDALPAGWAALAAGEATARLLRAGGVPTRTDVELTGADWVLLRPDRYVFARGGRAELPGALAAMRRLLPPG